MWMIELAINTMIADNKIGSQSAASETMRTSSTIATLDKVQANRVWPERLLESPTVVKPFGVRCQGESKIAPIEDCDHAVMADSVTKPAAFVDHFSGALLLGVCDLAWSGAQRCGAPQGTVRSRSKIPVHRHRRPLNHFRLLAAQKQDHPRDLLRLRPLRKIRVWHRLAVCRRVNDARQYRIDPHAAALQIRGQRIDHRECGCLR